MKTIFKRASSLALGLTFAASIAAASVVLQQNADGTGGVVGLPGTINGVKHVGGAATPGSNTAGGIAQMIGGAGDGTGAGGAVSVTGGASGAGATGAGGAANLTGGASAATNDVGGAVNVTGGAGIGTGNGGAIVGAGGLAGATGTGGAVSWTGGAGGATSGTGGATSLVGGAGTASAATGGAAAVTGGAGGATGNGGAVTITSGAGGATSGNSGNINLTPGAVVSGTRGSVVAIAGNGTGTYHPAGILNFGTNLTSTGTGADTSEDVLQTFSLPANTFDQVGRAVRVTCFGTTGATANNKTMKLYFGASVITTPTAATNNKNWWLDLVVTKTGSSTQFALGRGQVDTTMVTPMFNAGADTDTAGITIKCTGTNGTSAANDVVAKQMIVEVLP